MSSVLALFQDAVLQKLIDDNYLSQEERFVLYVVTFFLSFFSSFPQYA